MSIESDLRQFLITRSAVTAIVGEGDDAQIRPDILRQGTDLPAVIIEVDDDVHQNSLDGVGGLVYSYVTLRCRAYEKADARSLAEAIRTNGTDPTTGLAGYDGPAGDSTISAVLEDEQASFTPSEDGSDNGVYDVFCNYVISHSETT